MRPTPEIRVLRRIAEPGNKIQMLEKSDSGHQPLLHPFMLCAVNDFILQILTQIIKIIGISSYPDN